ncbi:hypothetical protein HDU98_006466 [Podochytrium sp. JEL0797]|nr:hypothetical protein HDU98_006466 [Podochytrium sp. JEL0797]
MERLERLAFSEQKEKLREKAQRASRIIDQRLHLLRTTIKQPRKVQMIEKHILTFYWWTFGPLMIVRYVDFHRRKWHYFILDFCYFTNSILFYFLTWDPTNKYIFNALFVWCNGPVMWAIVMWRNGLVFHSFSHITSIHIHIVPSVVTYVLRWIPTPEALASDLCVAKDCTMSWLEVFNAPIALYLLWQSLYLIKTEWIDRKKLAADTEIGTSLRQLLVLYEKHPLGKFATAYGPSFTTAMFVIMQLIYTAIVSVPTYFFYQYQWLHLTFIIFITTMSVWNGAGYYIFKLSRNNSDPNNVPDNPAPTEAWYETYIRRGNQAQRQRRPSFSRGGKFSGTESDTSEGRKRRVSNGIRKRR